MDAIKFVKEKTRMCNSMTCGDCPVSQNNSGERCTCSDLLHDHTEKYVAIIERWSKEHPENTRESKLLKLFPNAKMLSEGTLDICPALVDNDFNDCDSYEPCIPCKENYWRKEISDDE